MSTNQVWLGMLNGTYMGPVFQPVQTDVAGGVHTWTGWVDHHGDRWTDITARTGHRMGLMKPDTHWNIILTTCTHMIAPSQQNQTRLIN